MKSILNSSQFDIEINKSKFISFAYPVSSEKEVATILADIKSNHPKATHICYGYVLKQTEKFSDDGEPSYTAGKPILDTIKKQMLTNVLVVVVRNFGGVKLGAGGLVHAYTKSASGVLNLCKIASVSNYLVYNLIISYQEYESKFKNFANSNNIKILSSEFLDNVNLMIAVNQESAEIIDTLKNSFDIIGLKLIQNNLMVD